MHALQLTVTNVYNGATSHSTTVNGDLIVVNRTASPYGAGWSVAGIGQLVPGQRAGALLRVEADGSAAVYDSIAPDTWLAHPGAFRDTIRYEYISDPGIDSTATWQAGNYYWSRDLDGTRTFYDGSTGLTRWVHTKTDDLAQYTYGGSGELTSIRVAPHSATLDYTLAYASGKLTSVEDPSGRVLDVTVSSGRLTELLDPGRPTTQKVLYAYTNNLLTSRRSVGGHYTTYAYHPSTSLLSQVTLPATQAGSGVIAFTPVQARGLWTAHGTAMQFTSNATIEINGARTDVQDIAKFWVNGEGAPTKIQGPTGDVTMVQRTNAVVPALPTRVILHNGRIIDYIWNPTGTLAQMRDSTLHVDTLPTAVTRYTYNSPNTKARPDSIIDPVNLFTTFTYRTDGQISEVTGPNDHTTRFDYIKYSGPDGFRRQLQAVVEEAVMVFDSAQNGEISADPTTSFTYDSLGNLATQTSPRGGVTEFERDAAGRVQHVYDPEDHHNEFVHDALNRVTSSIHHASPSVSYTTYQKYGPETLDTVLDPRSVMRRFTYDALGRVTSEIDETNKVESHQLNLAGLVESTTTRKNKLVRHTYDAAGRTLKTAWPAADIPADSVMNQYNAMGQLLTAVNGRYNVTRTYYANGLLKSEVQSAANGTSNPYTNRYWYDVAGRRTKYAMGTGSTADSVYYGYDATKGSLKFVAVRWSTGVVDTVKFTMDGLGRRDVLVYAPHRPARSITVNYSYDLNGNMVRLCSQGGGQVGYVFEELVVKELIDLDDNVGRIRRGGEASCPVSGDPSTTYTYDSRHQVTIENTGGVFQLEHDYDASGNRVVTRDRTLLPVAGVDESRYAVPANMNRVSGWWTNYGTPDAFYMSVGYHDDGSRLAEYKQSTGQLRYQYYYDGLGRNTGFGYYDIGLQQNIAMPELCLYGPAGRLRKPCENGAVTLGHDGHNTVRTGPDGAPYSWTFVHGPGTDDPLMGYRTTTGHYIYFVTDGGGRQYAVGDTAGVNYSINQGYTSSTAGGKYAGAITDSHSFDAERYGSSLTPQISFFRNRFYDQATGRWTQEDPLGIAGGINLYAYSGNNPATYTDPFGLNPCLIPPVAAACWTVITAAVGALTLAAPGLQESAESVGNYMHDNARTALSVSGLLINSAAQRLVPSLFRSDEAPQLKIPVPGRSGAEAAKDVPSWARGNRPLVGESGKSFARRLLDQQYGGGGWSGSGPGSEFSKIKKWGDRGFIDPK